MTDPQRTPARSGRVAVLGAGVAGLAAAQALIRAGERPTVYEGKSSIGGNASSYETHGFLFDYGPHISFTKKQEIKDLLFAAVKGAQREFRTKMLNLWRGHMLPHPAQCHLYGLPPDLVEKCILDLSEILRSPQVPPTSYAEWSVQSLGRTFAETFTFEYTRKYWTVEAADLTVDWVGNRVHKPSLQEMVHGALSPQPPLAHYVSTFRYPEKGGFGAYLKAFDGVDVVLQHMVEKVDLKRREITFRDGRTAGYESLVSSLPMPELVRAIVDAPASVREAAALLRWTSVELVNVGLERNEGFPDAHWMYFYDPDISFSRANFPHALSSAAAPAGCGSVQVEIYHSAFKALAAGDVVARALDDMERTGLLRAEDHIRVAEQRSVRYANIIFDRNRSAAVEHILAFLQEHGVECCGRYGEWCYHWSDESIVSGWRAAERVLSRLSA